MVDDATDLVDQENTVLCRLLAAGAGGCDRSFAALHAATKTRLHRALVRVSGPGGDIDDLLQEVYLKAWLHAGKYVEARGSVVSWLRVIARNVALDSFRRSQAQPICISAAGAEEGPAYENVSCPRPTQDITVDQLRACHAVRLCVDSLSPGRRAVVGQAFFGELSHSEIADQSGLPLGTVKSHIRRSFESMRTPLEAFAWL